MLISVNAGKGRAVKHGKEARSNKCRFTSLKTKTFHSQYFFVGVTE